MGVVKFSRVTLSTTASPAVLMIDGKIIGHYDVEETPALAIESAQQLENLADLFTDCTIIEELRAVAAEVRSWVDEDAEE